MYDIKMQLKIIDSIIFVLSDLKLKNIYDNYYLNWHINNIDTNDDSFTLNLNKEKMDLINKVYINLYIEPIIKNEKADTEKLLAIFERVKQNFPKDHKEKTPEELDEIYEKMNTVTYNCNKIKFDSLDINKLLQTRINANANPNINYNYMNFITELLIKNNLDLKYSNDLINYWNWIKINLEYTDYNPNYNSNCENFEKIEKKINYCCEEEFIKNFNTEEFLEWVKNNNNNKLTDSEYNEIIKLRDIQTNTIKNSIDSRLNYYGGRKFTLQNIWDECDYSKTFDKN
jgi:hypothetical protein